MDAGVSISANVMIERLDIESIETLRKQYLDFAIKESLIKLTIPDKSTSKNQIYNK